jgi:NADH:ubiquinone oxidoreductase subunit 6 (subunit J)
VHFARVDSPLAFNELTSAAENLKAIQEGLYVNNPMLLLVSVCVLLVALVGAAAIKNQGNKT